MIFAFTLNPHTLLEIRQTIQHMLYFEKVEIQICSSIFHFIYLFMYNDHRLLLKGDTLPALSSLI